MHVLYVHPNFPAQFGPVALHLARTPGWRCTAVSEPTGGMVSGIEIVRYKCAGGARSENHFCSRSFENAIWHCDGIYRALAARPDLRPDLIVGHSGFGSTLFLRDLYPDVPVIHLFEYFYRPHHPDDDMDFRHDLAKLGWRHTIQQYQRARCRNAMILLDLQNGDAGFCPTQYQRSTIPSEYAGRLEVIFDGIHRAHYHGYGESLRPPPDRRGTRTIAGVTVPASTRLVTYVSRGFESLRGFDIFVRAARLVARELPDVLFVVVGEDKICYGGDGDHLPPGVTFKQWVLSRENLDAAELSRFIFTGRVNPQDLGRILAASDLHIYLTAPFVLSWSMMNAMSCGGVVLGSDTAPVREMIRDGENGLLADFFDAESMAKKAVAALRDPGAFRPLGRSAERLIEERYSVDAVLPQMLGLYEKTRLVR